MGGDGGELVLILTKYHKGGPWSETYFLTGLILYFNKIVSNNRFSSLGTTFHRVWPYSGENNFYWARFRSKLVITRASFFHYIHHCCQFYPDKNLVTCWGISIWWGIRLFIFAFIASRGKQLLNYCFNWFDGGEFGQWTMRVYAPRGATARLTTACVATSSAPPTTSFSHTATHAAYPLYHFLARYDAKGPRCKVHLSNFI